MPSDERIPQVLHALRGATGEFLSAIALAADEIEAYLAREQSTLEERAARLVRELGPFAAGRIDAGRCTALLGQAGEPDPRVLDTLRRARATLSDLAARKEQLFAVSLPEGDSLRDATAAALGGIGRAFGAVRLAREARGGGGRVATPVEALDTLPFARWTRAERRLALPLVIEVEGRDLRAASLSEFLDGCLKIVLVVKGECAPAPLVRLVTPGTFVLQTADASGFDRLAAWDGAAVAALVPAGAAGFCHDPAGGSASWERLAITAMPDRPPRKAVGGFSPAQQADELALLQALATRPAGLGSAASVSGGSAAAAAGQAAGDPAERLAAWMLSQADLSDVG